MKNNTTIIIKFVLIFLAFSCTELNLVPLDHPTTAPFLSVQQFREGINEGYREVFYEEDAGWYGRDDDQSYRAQMDDPIKAGILEGSFATDHFNIKSIWAVMYKAVARMVSIKNQILNQNGILSDNQKNQFLGEVNFCLANFYSYLISHFGDVPYFEKQLSITESFAAGRTPKDEILKKIYEFYDQASANLPTTHSGLQYATKGAALAMKARIALYMGDFNTAAEAAKNCMDLGKYALHPNFEELFLTKTRVSKEHIFYIPRDESKSIFITDNARWQYKVPRNRGGYGALTPTWQLLASFECVDGKPIDKSNLFDRKNPFKNRDPRCAATIVSFGSLKDGDEKSPSDGTRFLDREYTSHPERKTILNYETNKQVTNNDTRSVQEWGSWTGLLLKKGIDEESLDGKNDANRIIIRYADVLLMYAEAKIELGEIDESVLSALNQVRDRAYANSGHPNPEVTTLDQGELRYIVRNERRVELAFEGLRYMDLIRWKLAKKLLSAPIYGLKVNHNVRVPEGDWWFWSVTPQLDEDGYADFAPLVDAGFARVNAKGNFPDRQYLWPIPTEEVLLAPNLRPNNPGY